MIESISLGPWAGIDSKHNSVHAAFQLGDRPAFLKEATNVVLDDSGWFVCRPGTTEKIAVSGIKQLYYGAGLLLAHTGSTIEQLDLTGESADELVSGLTPSERVHFHALGGKVFWANASTRGIITDGANTNWGMATPASPSLGSTAGTLPAGRYRVSCRLVDGNGVLSAAPKATAITLSDSKAITFNVTPDANAVYVRIYCSYANTPQLWFNKQVAVGALPATITDVLGSTASSEPLDGLGFNPPFSGIEGVSSWGGFLLIWKDEYLAHSAGNNHHLFDLKQAVWRQDAEILGAVGIPSGPLWVATSHGMVRYLGAPNSNSFVKRSMDTREYAKGFALIDGRQVPLLQGVSEPIAVFASNDGLVFGLPDGQLVAPSAFNTRWDVSGKQATIALSKQHSFNQLITILE